MVVAKFYVTSVELFGWATKVKLNAVTKGAENHEFWQATPSGSIEMTIKNEAAAAHFKPGQEMEVRFDV
jgi:hypothetical protein